MCRELTKLHEEVVRGTSAQVYEIFAAREAAEGIKGEIVMVIDGPSAEERAADSQQKTANAARCAQQWRARGMSKKDIAATLVSELGISRNEAYALALSEPAS